MASLALGVKCISPGRHVFITGFLMALTAVVGVIIFNVMMAVQTFQAIGVRVHEMGEKNFACLVLKHESHWIFRGRGCERCVANNTCDQKNDHDP